MNEHRPMALVAGTLLAVLPWRGCSPPAARLLPRAAQTQHSRHKPQSSGLRFAEVPEGEENKVRTGRSSP